jgi:beta-glucosidase-like glycosyl hydrolase
MKHFPGIGFATRNTDSYVVTITASKASLAPGLEPYQKAIAHQVPLIMLSNATYTAYDSANGAGWSHAVSVGLLRTTLRYTGATITDSLSGTAAARGVSATSLAIRAAQAGTDMIMLTGSEASSAATYASLLQAVQNATISLSTLQTSYSRILALKARIKQPPADATAPALTTPDSRLYFPSTLGTTSAPARTSWSATDACGISGYGVDRQSNGGAYTVQALATPRSSSIAQSLGVGSTYRYAAKATDGAGNTRWAAGATIEPVLTQQTSTGIGYTGTWATGTSSSYSGGTTRYATVAGAKATYPFSGSSVAWVTATGPTRGSAKVYIDGIYKGTINLYSSTVVVRRIPFAYSWTASGSHRITIVAVGTTGHPRVDLDAFVRLIRP